MRSGLARTGQGGQCLGVQMVGLLMSLDPREVSVVDGVFEKDNTGIGDTVREGEGGVSLDYFLDLE